MAISVVTTASSAETTNVSSHDLTLPAGLTSGDLLVGVFVCDAAEGVTWAESMVSITHVTNGMTLDIAYKIATGSESGTGLVTTTSNENSSHVMYRINGDDTASNVPESSTGATGSSTTPDPDSITPGGGADDYLWIACAGHNDGRSNITTEPSGYSSVIAINSGGAQGCGIGVAHLLGSADTSEDPGTFTLDTTELWGAATIAIYPAAAAAPRRIFVM